MPPSPQPDYSNTKPLSRRATSLPPDTGRIQRSPTPISIIRQKQFEATKKADTDEEGVEIEELSPEAIIPDSVTIMRDPEVEVPDDGGDSTEVELEKKITAIKLERMHDDSGSEESGKEVTISPTKGLRKRKYSPLEETGDEPQRKKMASPSDSSSSRMSD